MTQLRTKAEECDEVIATESHNIAKREEELDNEQRDRHLLPAIAAFTNAKEWKWRFYAHPTAGEKCFRGVSPYREYSDYPDALCVPTREQLRESGVGQDGVCNWATNPLISSINTTSYARVS